MKTHLNELTKQHQIQVCKAQYRSNHRDYNQVQQPYLLIC